MDEKIESFKRGFRMKNNSPQENCENFNSNSPVDTLKTLKEIVEELNGENQAQIQFYQGRNKWAFDEIQKILDKKEKGDLSIDLDIKYKIFNQIHHDSVKAFEFCKYIEDVIKKLKRRI